METGLVRAAKEQSKPEQQGEGERERWWEGRREKKIGKDRIKSE